MVLKGYARKTGLALAGLVAAGWILIVVGFAIQVAKFNSPLVGSPLYSWWMVILVTPIMLITAVIYAILDRNREVTDILGSITTFLSALFLTALGFLLNFYGDSVHRSVQSRSDVAPHVALQFSGALLAGVFWVVFPLVGLVALGWLFIVIGFGIENNETLRIHGIKILPATGSISSSLWMVILIIPGMLVMAIVQAAIDRNKVIMNIIGACTTFLSALFLTALGCILSTYGSVINTLNDLNLLSVFPAEFSLQFSGAIIAGLFWVALSCISHFYEREEYSQLGP